MEVPPKAFGFIHLKPLSPIIGDILQPVPELFYTWFGGMPVVQQSTAGRYLR
jgi:hypothetical protein